MYVSCPWFSAIFTKNMNKRKSTNLINPLLPLQTTLAIAHTHRHTHPTHPTWHTPTHTSPRDTHKHTHAPQTYTHTHTHTPDTLTHKHPRHTHTHTPQYRFIVTFNNVRSDLFPLATMKVCKLGEGGRTEGGEIYLPSVWGENHFFSIGEKIPPPPNCSAWQLSWTGLSWLSCVCLCVCVCVCVCGCLCVCGCVSVWQISVSDWSFSDLMNCHPQPLPPSFISLSPSVSLSLSLSLSPSLSLPLFLSLSLQILTHPIDWSSFFFSANHHDIHPTYIVDAQTCKRS